MPLISYRARQRRMLASEQAAWQTADESPLREGYDEIRRAPIRLMACPLVKDVNHGSLLRIGDAYRLDRVDLTIEADRAIDCSASRGTRRWQPHRWLPATEPAVDEAIAEGRQIVALHLGPESIHLDRVDWHFPTTILLGSEADGVPPEVLAKAHVQAAIPLFGLVTSLNVAVAAALAVQSAVDAYRQADPSFLPVREESRRLLA